MNTLQMYFKQFIKPVQLPASFILKVKCSIQDYYMESTNLQGRNNINVQVETIENPLFYYRFLDNRSKNGHNIAIIYIYIFNINCN